jgi:uncharacterized protein
MPDTHRPTERECEFRFYEELNDFLPPERRGQSFAHRFTGTPSVKDTTESLGVPHTEVDLLLVDGQSVGFGHILHGAERVAVYPVFELLDISPLNHLRPRPLRHTRFILDVHLGKLARQLRLLGFDALYRNDYDDPVIVALAVAQSRVILTRGRGILKHSAVTHGYWVRNTQPRAQLQEVVNALDLKSSARPFTRCMGCNGRLEAVAEGRVLGQLPPRVREQHSSFVRCSQCGKLYWPGTHYHRMRELVGQVLGE